MTELGVRAELLHIWMIEFNSTIFNTDAYGKHKSPDPNVPSNLTRNPVNLPLAQTNPVTKIDV